MKQMYVRVEWPESQVVPEFFPEYFDQCILVEDAGYLVPVEIWSKYQVDSERVV